MIEQEATIDKSEEKKHKAIKGIFLFFAIFVCGLLFLSSCTKAFTSDSDKANQLYVQMYGQDSANSTYDESTKKVTEEAKFTKTGENYLYALSSGTYNQNLGAVAIPDQKFFDYISIGYEIDFNIEVPTVTPIKKENNSSLANGLSKPQTWLNDKLLTTNDEATANSIFGEEIVQAVKHGKTRSGSDWAKLDFSKEDDRNYYLSCFQSAKAVTLFAGYKDDKITLWDNMDLWFMSARDEIGIASAPSNAFVTYYKQVLNTAISSNRAGLNTSGTGGMYGQEGNKIYIQNKTWGQAFSEYGFLEGLLVWPIGWLVNTFVDLFGAGSGWAELAAIFLVTLIVRIILVIFTIFTSKSQSRMTELQGEVNEIQAKYPNAQTDMNEKQMMSREVSALYKKHHVKPWLQIVQLIIQFPLFICVWAALEGSAALSSGNFFGVELTAKMSDVIMNSTGTSLAMGTRVLAGIMLVLMFLSQFFSMTTAQWFNKWKTNRFYNTKKAVKNPNSDMSMDPNKMSKWMTIIMMIFMVIMGITLPAGMSMYWFFGAIISIFQVFITEAIASRDRHKRFGKGGTDNSLAAMRRSKHHQSIRSSR